MTRSSLKTHSAAMMLVALAMLAAAAVAQAAIVSGGGTGDITYHSTLYPDGSIVPSHTTGPAAIPQDPNSLKHEIFAPFGLEHSIMSMSWDFDPGVTDVFIPIPASPLDVTKVELSPSPPAAAHHKGEMTGTFEILYSLDAGGLPLTVIPAQVYKVVSYVSTLPLSPAGATFDAHWEYEDVGFGVLGVQDISYVAPVGLGVLATVSSLPLAISVPAGHPTLKVSGFFKLTADSDDFMGGPPPFDTLIAIVPEPATLGMAVLGALALMAGSFRRRRRLRC